MANHEQKLDKNIMEAYQLCGLAIQKYIAYVDSQEIRDIFDDVAPVQGMKFKAGDSVFWMNVDIVDKDWMFSLDEHPGDITKKGMIYFVNNMSAMYQVILQNLDVSRLKNPDRFIESKLVCDPQNTTMVAFNPSHGKDIRDLPKRIGFTWNKPDAP